jgi:hypothetical protein
MCHLLTDPSTDVQMTAYHLLQGAAKKRTEYLVIEAGVDAEATVKDGLPKELLDILQQSLAFNQIDEFEQDEQVRVLRDTHNCFSSSPKSVFGYVLGWMVIFDLFLDAVCLELFTFVKNLLNVFQVSEG